jgi:Dyp-type peroxidase family
VSISYGSYTKKMKYRDIEDEEKRLIAGKRKQPGVSFPSPRKQDQLLIIRLDLEPSAVRDIILVRSGLKRLCDLLDCIDKNIVKIDELLDNGEIARSPLSKFNFSATIGFGSGFFEKLEISQERWPRRLYEMPNHIGLLDQTPYLLSQTDLLIQIGSTQDFVNRWVFQNDVHPLTKIEKKQQHRYQGLSAADKYDSNSKEDMNIPDIVTAIKDWAAVTDVHSGFQRLDGRNLMGFHDGISNPNRLQNDVVWTTQEDEGEKLKDGTYMVFQKIEHDLEQWRKLGMTEQEKWVGRSKRTGLLLGTLSKNEDEKLASDCKSEDPLVRKTAIARLRKLLDEQSDPEKRFFDSQESRFKNIQLECPVWCHVRKANPRGVGSVGRKPIFRRGYLFMDDSLTGNIRSGLLFICFQKDIRNGFEYIKKYFLNDKDFPVTRVRKNFTKEELEERHRHARFSDVELESLGRIERAALGLNSRTYSDAIRETQDPDTQNTGREGLAGPSELGIEPRGEFLATVPLGGGYYFIPPIPNKKISDIGDQFFD